MLAILILQSGAVRLFADDPASSASPAIPEPSTPPVKPVPPAAKPPATPAAKPIAYTDRNQVDEDFRFQGEYRGWQKMQKAFRSIEAIGLQVMAQGDGQFTASKYYGGLPGDGWNQGERFAMSGSLTDGQVQLTGGQYDILVDGYVATIYTHSGERVGELTRVERVSPTMGATPPMGAVVLFDGADTSRWKGGKVTPEGLLQAGCDTVDTWQDFRLHAEFMLPYKPKGRGQDRGNSGFYLQSRYEVQVLDSFGHEGIENECGSLYRTRRPDVNMCLPPLQWQTYDIDLKSAKFDASGKKISDMVITVWHNGVLVHNNVSIPTKTGAGKPESPEGLPTKLQDHGNPVVYRNIWLVDKTKPVPGTAGRIQIDHLTPPTPSRSTFDAQPQLYPPPVPRAY